jgi:hypothetical protein
VEGDVVENELLQRTGAKATVLQNSMHGGDAERGDRSLLRPMAGVCQNEGDRVHALPKDWQP